jgi:hypothetical protein
MEWNVWAATKEEKQEFLVPVKGRKGEGSEGVCKEVLG